MKIVWQALMMLLIMTILTGIIYPMAMTGIAQLFLNEKSNGSLIKDGSNIVGSRLIAQQFTKVHYFWPRPSASGFNAVPSQASNLGPTSEKLKEEIKKRRAELAVAHQTPEAEIPVDLLTASGSGLDPHISIKAARLQMKRVAAARDLSADQHKKLESLVSEAIEPTQLGFLGEPRVNVFLLNRTIDSVFGKLTK